MKTIYSALLVFMILATSLLDAKPIPSTAITNPKYDAIHMVKMAFRNVPKNYCNYENVMTAFYRETINRESNCVSVNEAILDISKASYMSGKNDKIFISKARGNTPTLQGCDALMMKFQGGPNSALSIDVVKHPFLGTDLYNIGEYYNFKYGTPEVIDNKDYYVVVFDSKYKEQDIMFRGKIYIEPETYAISRVAFSMNVENRSDAYLNFIKQKPSLVNMDVQKATYVVNYKNYNNKWYFDYSTSEVTFNVKWKKMDVNSEYTLRSQLAVTNLTSKDVKIDKKDLLKPSDIVAEKVKEYNDTTNWDVYNLIMLLALK